MNMVNEAGKAIYTTLFTVLKEKKLKDKEFGGINTGKTNLI